MVAFGGSSKFFMVSIRWLVSFIYEGIELMCGDRYLSMSCDRYSVGCPFPLMMGLPGGWVMLLWIFGRMSKRAGQYFSGMIHFAVSSDKVPWKHIC